MLQRIRELADARRSFAFETTLASRSFEPWIRKLVESGFRFHLVFLWLPDADFACARVMARVESGGHDVPVETIRRRYLRGLGNFLHIYLPLATTWRIYDNSLARGPRSIARGANSGDPIVFDEKTWNQILSDG
jgi:predicted ABC-type ATPase